MSDGRVNEGEEDADKIDELKEINLQTDRPKSKIGGERSIIASESRISIGKSTYTYLNSLEQRLEDEKHVSRG